MVFWHIIRPPKLGFRREQISLIVSFVFSKLFLCVLQPLLNLGTWRQPMWIPGLQWFETTPETRRNINKNKTDIKTKENSRTQDFVNSSWPIFVMSLLGLCAQLWTRFRECHRRFDLNICSADPFHVSWSCWFSFQLLRSRGEWRQSMWTLQYPKFAMTWNAPRSTRTCNMNF